MIRLVRDHTPEDEMTTMNRGTASLICATIHWVLLLFPMSSVAQDTTELSTKQRESRRAEIGEHRARALSILRFSKALLHETKREYKQAETLYLESKSIREEAFGKEHPDYGKSVMALARLYKKMGELPRAKEMYLEAKAIREKTVGKEHPDYAKSLYDLASVCHSMGEYAQAATLYLEAKVIRANVLGKKHPDYARSVNALAGIYKSMGEYGRAMPVYLELKAIRGEVLGREHADYASSLTNLADLYRQMGNYENAESLHLEAIAIKEKALGKENNRYASSLTQLANLYLSMGDFVRAEPLLLEAKAIQGKVLGKEHRNYANTLNSLAVLYKEVADYTRSEPLFIEAMAIQEKVLGKEHHDYSTSLINLAGLYRSMRDFERAEPLLREAVAIKGKLLGKEHPDYAASVNNLGALYRAMEDYERAEPLYAEAKTIREKVLGKEHPDFASSLNNLAELYEFMGDYGRAEPLFLEAMAIDERVRGNEHPHHAAILSNLASLYQSMGDYTKAESLHLEAFDRTMQHVERTSYIQSEQQQITMNRLMRSRLNDLLRCCVDGGLDPIKAITRLVSWKGAILMRGRGMRLAAGDAEIADRFRQLQSIASEISHATRSVPKSKQQKPWRERIDALIEQQRKLEAGLVKRSAAFRQSTRKITLAEIRQAIPDGGVLIDYLIYPGKDGRALLATVIPRDGELQLIDLGAADKVEDAIGSWRESFGIAEGSLLRRQLWEPLLKHVHEARVILVSTDGFLGRLPLAALPGREPGTYLIDDYRIASIPVPQLLPEVVGKEVSRDAEYQSVLLVGDVNYDAGETDVESDRPPPAIETFASARAASGQTWSGLKETGREIEFIKGLFRQSGSAGDSTIIDLRGAAATESAFRAHAPDCQLLHLATHGFFAAAKKNSGMSTEVISVSPDEMGFGQSGSRAFEFSPGQLSGLVFAGANQPLAPIGPLADETEQDDGIMTADEIAYLPLEGVELAVLSACETGLGKIARGEGLIGIQRSFQVSGVDSIVATIWKVDDKMTRVLMERFYRNLFDKKLSKLDALREAQLWVLNHSSLVEESGNDRGSVRKTRESDAEVSKRGARTSPYYWAPFVLSGDWR